jgi:hypothetical protein
MLSHRPGERNRCINYSSGPHPERWFTGSICFALFSILRPDQADRDHDGATVPKP